MDADSTNFPVADCHKQCNYYDNDNDDDHKVYQGDAGEPTAIYNLIYCSGLRFVDSTGTATAANATAANATAANATAASIQLLADHTKRTSAADSPAARTRLLPAHAEQSTTSTAHSGLLSVTANRATASAPSLTGSASCANANCPRISAV